MKVRETLPGRFLWFARPEESRKQLCVESRKQQCILSASFFFMMNATLRHPLEGVTSSVAKDMQDK